MAKKAKPAAAKPATEKSAKQKPVAAKPVKTTAKPVKSAAKPAKPTAKVPPPTPRVAKLPDGPVATLPLGTPAPAAAPSLSDRYTSFEVAKNDTLDTLLASIEAAEARLLEVKRATSFEQLEPLANGDGERHT